MAIGIAAALVGLVTRFVPDMPGLWQLGLFIVLALIGTLIARKVRQNRGVDQPPHNDHGQ
jgi:membrane protein implicated in regulation of membrane protease activity